ncbi:MAG: hypothetical protein FD130_592 [Halothiobacillaceae bacterium]|nr:MAG: hypothetical protein FD130_592 [Halothiobacillaceae bacterium]
MNKFAIVGVTLLTLTTFGCSKEAEKGDDKAAAPATMAPAAQDAKPAAPPAAAGSQESTNAPK